MYRLNRNFSCTIVVCLVFSLFPFLGNVDQVSATNESDFIEVEAAPADGSIILEGPRKQINYIDQDMTGKSDYIALFSGLSGDQVTMPRNGVAVQVDADNRVLRVVNPSINGAPPAWEPNPVDLLIPQGGFVLIAFDDSYNNKMFKKFLATNFEIGDIIKLRKNGQVVPVAEVLGDGPQASLKLSTPTMRTTTNANMVIEGLIQSYAAEENYQVLVSNTIATLSINGEFAAPVTLTAGTNYIDVSLLKDGQEQERQSLSIYYKANAAAEPKEVFIWVEQGPNSKHFQSSEIVLQTLTKAKDAGVTSVMLDVKGYEGFVSYQQNDLTGRPYISEMTAPSRAGANPDLDILELMVLHGHALGMKVYASVNVFSEGSMLENGVLDDHPTWEEWVYRAEDQGAIVPIRQSAAPNKIVAFVNPANDEVRDYQLKTIEEIIKNYNVDGITLDRGRYDNDFADFSDVSRDKFEFYLQKRGKSLDNWPDDVYKINYEANGQAKRVEGKHILDWYAFRSGTIHSFTEEARALIDSYSAQKGKPISLSSYVGSWYESLYVNGINWASPDFRYDERLGFAESRIYTDDYYDTAYLRNLDFIMIGTYQRTVSEIQKYITLGNILTRGEVPLYASIQLDGVSDPTLQHQVLQAGLSNSDGLMLFDLSTANFDVIKASLQDRVYEKTYQLGMSVPGDPQSFIESDYLNTNRVDNYKHVFTSDFGISTRGNTYGVEISVDSTGKVVDTRNKTQAMTWVWTNIQPNDSLIPAGGLVISTSDQSGIRTNRQLIANTYSMGDNVRVAALHGVAVYDEMVTDKKHAKIEGSVEVLGFGETVQVLIDGSEVKLNKKALSFKENIKLNNGQNTVRIEVYVDGMKTNDKTITITHQGKK